MLENINTNIQIHIPEFSCMYSRWENLLINEINLLPA